MSSSTTTSKRIRQQPDRPPTSPGLTVPPPPSASPPTHKPFKPRYLKGLSSVFILIGVIVVLFIFAEEDAGDYLLPPARESELRVGDTSNKNCNLDSVFETWKARIPELVRKIAAAEKPTTARPLVFFHVRKASGTAIRKYLFFAAEAMQLPTWMVCYAVECSTYRLPTDQRYAVYGGHLNYADVMNVLGFDSQAQIPQPNPPAVVQSETSSPFDCLVSLRPTVSRVVSCWNYRFGGQDGDAMPGFRPAHDVSPAEWKRLLPTTFSRHSEGCNNELVRVFGDNTNEASVNTLLVDDHDMRISCRAAAELDVLLSRISKCTVLIHEKCPDNRIVAGHAMPWAKGWFNQEFCDDHSQKGAFFSRSLLPGAKEAILRQNRLDEYIFQFGLAMHQEQLQIATSSQH